MKVISFKAKMKPAPVLGMLLVLGLLVSSCSECIDNRQDQHAPNDGKQPGLPTTIDGPGWERMGTVKLGTEDSNLLGFWAGVYALLKSQSKAERDRGVSVFQNCFEGTKYSSVLTQVGYSPEGSEESRNRALTLLDGIKQAMDREVVFLRVSPDGSWKAFIDTRLRSALDEDIPKDK